MTVVLAAALQAGEPIVLKAEVVQSIAECLSEHGLLVRAATALDAGPVLIASDRANSGQWLIRLDASGACVSRKPINEPVSPHWIAVEATDRFSVLQQSANRVFYKKVTIDASGTIVARSSLQTSALRLSALGNTHVALTATEMLEQYDSDGRVTRKLSTHTPASGPFTTHVVPISGDIVLVINGATGLVSTFNIASGVVLDQKIVAPEDVEAALARYGARRSSAIVFNQAVSNGRDHALISFGAVSLADGALVLEVDRYARVSRSFRCLLPKMPGYAVPGNPNGHMAPALIASTGNGLWIIDPKGAVSHYLLPDSGQ